MPRSILDTPLLKKTLADQGEGDQHAHERKLLRDALLQMREKAEILVQEIPRDIPGLTVHDVTHLDALWEMAALIAGDNYPLTPAEAFVFGGAILLHDAAMSLAAYPGGFDELKETMEWRDEAAAIRQESEPDHDSAKLDPGSEKEVLARALRARHAEQAKKIATRGWSTGSGSEYLIDNGELRSYYGELIGNIAHSHWWPVSKLESQLPRSINAARKLPHDWTVDPVRVACLLRVADAAHLSAARAPRFLMAIRNPKGQSALHWSFQTKLGNPRREDDRLIYATGSSFGIEETDAWWLCYDTLGMVQRELHDVDILLDGTNRTRLAAKQVAGAGSPDMLAKLVRVEGWKPVDAKLNVSNVPTLVRTLGGEKLYGDNPIYAVRELIQNSCDAIRARRILEKRPDDWGTITVGLNETTEGVWLVVSDDGIGMSERVLTGPLLDFGQSFWRSSLAKEEFPGLHAGGMSAIGQFGIGFFSIFMLGERVKVTSRRFDTGKDKALTLEFADGTAMRPIVRAAKNEEIEKDNITSIAVLLKNKPNKKGGIFYYNDYKNRPADPTIILSHLAPAIDANLIFYVGEKNVSCVRSNDWKNMNVADILLRSYHSPYPANEYDIKKFIKISSRMRAIGNSDNIYGVACIVSWNIWEKYGLLIVGGLKAQYLTGIAGFMFGSTQNAARNSAVPLAPPEMLANWASEQAFLISSLADVDDEFKANCAGVVLACGGDIKDLPIIRKGGEYINTHDFVDYLNNTNFIKLIDESDLDYDDENDDVLGRDYKNHFALDEDIIVIPSRTLANPLGQNNSWPYESHIRPTKPITLLDYFKQIVSDTWGEYYESDHHTDECICTVRSVEIIRQIEIWEREEKLSIYPEYERALSDPSDPDSPF